MNSNYHIINNFPNHTTLLKKAVSIAMFLFATTKIYYRDNFLTLLEYEKTREILQKGDIVLVGTFVRVSSLFIRGVVTHSLIYSGGKKLIHAIADGVEELDYRELFDYYDTLVILRPRFDEQNRGAVVGDILSYCKKQIGKPYNFTFNSSEDNFFCTQLINKSFDIGCAESSVDVSQYKSLRPSNFLKLDGYEHKFYSSKIVQKDGKFVVDGLAFR